MTGCDECNLIVEILDALEIDHGETTLCDTCFRQGEYYQCDDCRSWHGAYSIVADEIHVYCNRCYERSYFTCESCGYICNDTAYVGDGLCEDCSRCGSEDASYHPRNVTAHVVSGTPRDDPRTFGVEVEAMFDEGCPWCLGDYQSDTPAPMEFFSGWMGEEDCTVDGEFISPPLVGVEGLAEIAATFDVLQREGASMNHKAGQHTTVCTGNTCPRRVLQVTLVCEEALYATTGAYARMTGSYAPSLKGGGYSSHVKDGNGVYGSHYCASIRTRMSNLIEFRYPSGTLQPEQMVLNISLCKLMVHIAENISDEELDKLLAKSTAIEVDKCNPEVDAVHEQVKLGLWVIAFHGGWHKDGELKGLCYDPDDAPTVEVHDYSHDHNVEIEMPGRDEILERMKLQIGKFYGKMGMSYTTALQDSLSIVALDEASKEVLQNV